MNEENKITKEMTLAEVLKYSKANKILEKYELPCLHCPMATFEMGRLTIGQVTEMYGIDTKKLLKELNNTLEKD